MNCKKRRDFWARRFTCRSIIIRVGVILFCLMVGTYWSLNDKKKKHKSANNKKLRRGFERRSKDNKYKDPPPDATLKKMCRKRVGYIGSPWFLHNVKMGLRLLQFQAGFFLPASGSFLGTQRHGLLSAPWDDDFDFTIRADVFKHLRMLAKNTSAKGAAFKEEAGIHHISNTDLARRLAKQTFAAKKNVESVVTFTVTNPDDPQGRRHCISLVFSKWGFLQVKVHTKRVNEFAEQALCVGPGWKFFDVFPFGDQQTPSRTVADGTGLPFDRLVASAVLLEIEGIPMLITPRTVAHPILSEYYGQGWNDEAMLCPHSEYGNFQACRRDGKERVDLRAMETAMERLPICSSLIRSGKLALAKIPRATDIMPETTAMVDPTNCTFGSPVPNSPCRRLV